MREILFRGKHSDNKWYYGSLTVGNNQKVYISSCGEAFPIEVYPETVGQYTGLKDKNGRKIFEGDICEYDGDIGVVEFDTDDSMFTFTYDENIETNFGCLFGAELEVIGNVHDNPELLKGK